MIRAAILATILATPAMGQQCAPPGDVDAELARNYGEILQAHGNADSGDVMAIYANLQTQTWTLIVISGDMACLVASGDGYSQRWRGPVTDG
jgi:hypothetical protein